MSVLLLFLELKHCRVRLNRFVRSKCPQPLLFERISIQYYVAS